MINFRYHIVSLMAVFLALSVGIVIGVTLRPSVDEGLVQQAAQDRRQVQELRTELDRVSALDEYRESWALRVRPVVTAGLLDGQRVALVVMPNAPAQVVESVAEAVTEAGGTLTRTARLERRAFDPEQSDAAAQALSPYVGPLDLDETMTLPTRLGRAVGHAVLAKNPVEQDSLGSAITDSLVRAGLLAVDGDATGQAQLAIVVTAESATPAQPAELQNAHLQFDLALTASAVGVVVAGPNSEDIQGTDVLGIRNDATTVNVLSTVDVADLASGVTTAVLAGKEQLLGRQGHYGALTGADAPTPELPVR